MIELPVISILGRVMAIILDGFKILLKLPARVLLDVAKPLEYLVRLGKAFKREVGRVPQRQAGGLEKRVPPHL